jgi:DNA-binding SARP family transcriptional activator
VQFRILGPLEVLRAGRQLHLGRPKQRAVLAILLLHANRVVALDRLVEELWGEQPPPQAIGSLQAYVSHLRRLLEPDRSARTPAGVLLSQPPGYRLVIAPEDLDASRFQALAADGHGLLEAGDHRRAAAVLAESLALWRGPVLADFADAPFAQAERQRLEELRLVVLEDRVTAELALGRHGMAAAELEQLVAAHPFRERLHGLRMLALYRSGRQAEALQAYQAAGRTLRDELGIDPGPWLRRLEADILNQSPDLDLPPAAAGPVLPAAPAAAPAGPDVDGEPKRLAYHQDHGIPDGDQLERWGDAQASLVGREAQLAAFEATLAGVSAGRGRMVLVTGEPGIAGREFDLDTVQAVTGLDDTAALEAMEAALLSGLLVEDAERVGRFRFAHALVRDAIYDDASRARRARLHARIGQALLGREGADGGNALALAHHWWLAAPVVDADAVLPHLLTAADQALGLLAHEQAERQLRRALELLASMRPSAERSRSELGVHMRLAGLSAQLHGIASPSTRETVARAADLAEQLGDDPATIAAYRNLYEVAVARAEHAAARELAERMLEIAERSGDPTSLAVTQLAVGRTLWCQGEPAAAREHLEHSLRLAAGAPEAQHEPLPAAVTTQLQLAPVLDLLGFRRQAVELVDAAIERTRDRSPLVRAGVLTSAALVTGLRRDPALAHEHASEAFALAGKLPAWLSYATAVRSWAQALRGDPEAGARRLRESLDDIQARGAQHLVPWGLGLLAEAELLAGRPQEALGLLDDALARAERSGERMYLAEIHRLRGQVLLACSPARPTEARAALDTAVAVAREQGAELLQRRAAEDLRRLDPTVPAHSSSDSQTSASSAPPEPGRGSS